MASEIFKVCQIQSKDPVYRYGIAIWNAHFYHEIKKSFKYYKQKLYNPIGTNVCTCTNPAWTSGSGKVETKAYTYIVGYTKMF